MFWKETIKQMNQISLDRYKITQKRINQLSDYIQGPLADVIDKAVKEAVKQSTKKDK